MTPDAALFAGLVLAALSIPSMFSAYSENRAPRVSAVLVLTAGGLILWAFRTKPGGYTPEQLPDAFFTVLGQIIR